MSDTSTVHMSLGVRLFPWYISLWQHSFKLCTTFCPGGFSFSHMALKLDFPVLLSISSSSLQSLAQWHCKYALSFYSDLKGTDLGTPALLAQGRAMNFSTGNNDKDKHMNMHTLENKWERFKENLTEHLKPQQTWKKARCKLSRGQIHLVSQPSMCISLLCHSRDPISSVSLLGSGTFH